MTPVMLPVVTLSDAMKLRRIRNEARQFMTRDQKPISRFKQWRWHRTQSGNSMWAYLLCTPEPVGYGLLRCDNKFVSPTGDADWSGRHWVSGAVLAERRGVGFGRRIFEFMTAVGLEHAEQCIHRRQLWLEVWQSNTRARHLYESLGYREVGRTDPALGPVVITMRWSLGAEQALYPEDNTA